MSDADMRPRPFRFSGRLAPFGGSEADWRAAVRRIEAAGFSAAVVPDHLTLPGFLDMTAALMAAADATRTLRVLSLVAANDFRHPVLLHKAAATVDVLSGGRLELGIGA